MEAMTREELNKKNMLILSGMKEYFDKHDNETDKAARKFIIDNFIDGLDPTFKSYFYANVADTMAFDIYKYIITHYTEDVNANVKLAEQGKKPYYFIFTERSDFKDVNYLFYTIRQELISKMREPGFDFDNIEMPPIETLNAYLSYQETDNKEQFLDDANNDYFYLLFSGEKDNLTNNQVNEESEEPESGAPGR